MYICLNDVRLRHSTSQVIVKHSRYLVSVNALVYSRLKSLVSIHSTVKVNKPVLLIFIFTYVYFIITKNVTSKERLFIKCKNMDCLWFTVLYEIRKQKLVPLIKDFVIYFKCKDLRRI